jgi:tripartite-type tricarboxylate transporter receptor subunit TctC
MLKSLLSVVLLVTTTFAMAWQPTKLVTMVIPAPPGGSVDNVARVVVKKMNQLGVKTIPLNQVGGGGSIGTNAVRKSSPDGHTLLFNPTSFVFGKVNQLSGYEFDILEDFTHISPIALGELYIYANPKIKESLGQVIENTKKGDKSYNWATSSPIGFFVLSELASKLNTEINIIRYNNLNVLNDLISGEIDIMIDSANHPARNFISQDKVKLLGSLNSRDTKNATLNQYVFGITASTWMGISAPAGLSKDTVSFYQRLFSKIVTDYKVQEKFSSIGVVPDNNNSMKSLVEQTYKKYNNVK